MKDWMHAIHISANRIWRIHIAYNVGYIISVYALRSWNGNYSSWTDRHPRHATNRRFCKQRHRVPFHPLETWMLHSRTIFQILLFSPKRKLLFPFLAPSVTKIPLPLSLSLRHNYVFGIDYLLVLKSITELVTIVIAVLLSKYLPDMATPL